ncbi:MAG: hypothetical protein QXL15_05010 [Candidatus Korarchaeota archaeon]
MVHNETFREVGNTMMSKILKKHGFWVAREPYRYVAHNERYGTIEVELKKDEMRSWQVIATVKIKEINMVASFDSAKKLNSFLNRVEQNTRLYGFVPIPAELLSEELKQLINNI